MRKLIIAIAALAMFASSAYAADWNFYGNARFYTFYESTDHDTAGTEDTEGTVWTTSPYSRIGANIKVSDELTGRFEWDIATDIRIRILYGEWNFGAGSLGVGQNWTLTNIFGSNQVGATELGLGGWGEMGGFRASQIRLTFGDFALALVETNTDVNSYAAYNAAWADWDALGQVTTEPTQALAADTADTEVKMPAIQAKYTFRGDNFKISGVGAYSKFDVKAGAAGDQWESVTSYLVGVGGDIAFGGFTVYASVHGGDNIGNLQNGAATNGSLAMIADGSAGTLGTAGQVVDNQNFSYRLVGNYAMNDMMSFEIGYGYTENEYDVAGSTADKAQSYYANMPIVVAPGVIITPEIGVTDEKEAGEDKMTYFGVHWRMNF